MPNTVVAKRPTIGLRGQSKAVRNHCKVSVPIALMIKINRVFRQSAHISFASHVLIVNCLRRVFVSTLCADEAITQIHPTNTIIPKHALQFAHHQKQMPDECLDSGFIAKRTTHRRNFNTRRSARHWRVNAAWPIHILRAFVFPQTEIRRRRDNRMNRLISQWDSMC